VSSYQHQTSKSFVVVVKIERDSKRASKEPPMDLTEALL
tara:strand:+ start:927 stop:1043 length:117 start_codon:yes stop_codon:yes gene_type:complete